MPIKVLHKDLDIGQLVYLVTDDDQYAWQVDSIKHSGSGEDLFDLFRNGEYITVRRGFFTTERNMATVLGLEEREKP